MKLTSKLIIGILLGLFIAIAWPQEPTWFEKEAMIRACYEKGNVKSVKRRTMYRWYVEAVCGDGTIMRSHE